MPILEDVMAGNPVPELHRLGLIVDHQGNIAKYYPG